MARRRLPRIFGYRGKPPQTREASELNTSDEELLSGNFHHEEDYGMKIAHTYGFTAVGGTKRTYSGYTSHEFTSSGTMTIECGEKTVEYLIVGGGAGGGMGGGSGMPLESTFCDFEA